MRTFSSFIETLRSNHEQPSVFPSRKQVEQFLNGFFSLLFPDDDSRLNIDPELALNAVLADFTGCVSNATIPQNGSINTVLTHLRERIPELYEQLLDDAHAIEQGDPAAVSREEVVHLYPGFLAIAHYRLAHILARQGVRIIPRMITEIAHSKTGIDIHPNARIGNAFFIDHGTGVVIGETTEIGHNVKIYQGVTLGALSVQKELAATKRHPSIGNEVVIYAGATILGGETVIGEGAVIGGNAWITQSIPPQSLVVNTAEVIIKNRLKHVNTH